MRWGRRSGRMSGMTIRAARIQDAGAICELINYYAERGTMLHRSLEDVYRTLRGFRVAEDDGQAIVGCSAVEIFWADLAEVKSLAVRRERRGMGIGSRLLRAAIDDATEIGVRRLFALTYEKAFFERHGFRVIDRQALPEKVWRECIACPKVDACDEIAMIRQMPAAEEALIAGQAEVDGGLPAADGPGAG